MKNIYIFILSNILQLGATCHSEPIRNKNAAELDSRFLEKCQLIIFGENKNKNGKSYNNIIAVIKDTENSAEKINLSGYRMRKNRHFLYIQYKEIFSGETRVVYADENENFTIGKYTFNVSQIKLPANQ